MYIGYSILSCKGPDTSMFSLKHTVREIYIHKTCNKHAIITYSNKNHGISSHTALQSKRENEKRKADLLEGFSPFN